MVLAATTAAVLTSNAVRVQNSQSLDQEIGLAENAIRRAAVKQGDRILYNATIIGNPPGDPARATLTRLQNAFYTAFVQAGYQVGWDQSRGYWRISWAATGAERLVRVYSVRTTLTPGAVERQTITEIINFFGGLVPTILARATFVGNLDETVFGATARTFYEYAVVAAQTDQTDHRSALTTALQSAGLGYSRGNVASYKLA